MKQLGCYYMHMFYPTNLYLEDKKSYLFEFESKKISVLIVRHFKSLMINDFSNKIVRIDNEVITYDLLEKDISITDKTLAITFEGDENGVTFLVDYKKHLYREFYQKPYTEIILNFEGYASDNNVEFGMRALKYFISSYRLVCDDILALSLDKMPYISKVTKEFFYVYTNDDLKVAEEIRLQTNREGKLGIKQLNPPFYHTDGKKFATNPERNTEKLNKFLSNKSSPDAMMEFILKAKEEHYIHGNYKYSFIESWTSIEIAIVAFLRMIKSQKGISKNKMDSYESEVGISYLINIELPLVASENQNLVDMIPKVDSIRKLRNKVIHENRNITMDESHNALTIAINFLNLMGYKKY